MLSGGREVPISALRSREAINGACRSVPMGRVSVCLPVGRGAASSAAGSVRVAITS